MSTEILSAFADFAWHDAQISSIQIDRSEPGVNDSIVLHVCWADGKLSKVWFKDCYFTNLRLNMGIVAEETVLEASTVEDSDLVAELRSTWALLAVDLADILHFRIITNSTHSVIDLCCKGFEVIE